MDSDQLLVSFLFQSFLYLVWYTTMSILGHYNNFFFAAHLLDIAMGFKTLRTILSSVTHNGKQVRTRGMQVFFQAAGVTAELVVGVGLYPPPVYSLMCNHKPVVSQFPCSCPTDGILGNTSIQPVVCSTKYCQSNVSLCFRWQQKR